MGIRYAVASDIGLRRATNQDAHLEVVAPCGPGGKCVGAQLFLIADGMGAHAAGEVASQLAVGAVTKSFRHRCRRPYGRTLAESLKEAAHDAHNEVQYRGKKNEAYREMGTTLTGLLLHPDGGVIVHVGDSRAYRYRAATLQQLSFDHSLVWEVCQANGVPLGTSLAHIPRNQLTRSLGASPTLVVDLEGPFEIVPGDRFLLCSDGLNGIVSDQEMTHVLSLFASDVAVETLVNLANLGGGHDNITVTLIETRAITEEDWAMARLQRRSARRGVAGFLFGWLSLDWLPWRSMALAREHYGHGPYTTTQRDSGSVFALKLRVILKELHTAARNKRHTGHPQAESLAQQASAALEQSEWTTAIAHYCRSMNLLMAALKRPAE